MNTDIEMLETNTKNLERENRELRMTLRDGFASKAMGAFIVATADDTEMPEDMGYKIIASMAYDMADAMLEARK